MTGPWGHPKPPPRRPPRLWGIVAFVLALFSVAVFALGGGWAFDASETHRLVVALVVGAPLLVIVARRFRGQWTRGLGLAAVWVMIAFLAGVFWVVRHDLRDVGGRLMLAIMPGGADWMPGVVKIPADRSGHFVVEGRVNGAAIRFIVDTGASGVTLGARDAERAGFRLSALDYSQKALTAGGEVAVAPVRLGQIEVGSIRLTGFPATVNPKMTDVSLLGMSFLGRLSGFEIKDGALILRE